MDANGQHIVSAIVDALISECRKNVAFRTFVTITGFLCIDADMGQGKQRRLVINETLQAKNKPCFGQSFLLKPACQKNKTAPKCREHITGATTSPVFDHPKSAAVDSRSYTKTAQVTAGNVKKAKPTQPMERSDTFVLDDKQRSPPAAARTLSSSTVTIKRTVAKPCRAAKRRKSFRKHWSPSMAFDFHVQPRDSPRKHSVSPENDRSSSMSTNRAKHGVHEKQSVTTSHRIQNSTPESSKMNRSMRPVQPAMCQSAQSSPNCHKFSPNIEQIKPPTILPVLFKLGSKNGEDIRLRLASNEPPKYKSSALAKKGEINRWKDQPYSDEDVSILETKQPDDLVQLYDDCNIEGISIPHPNQSKQTEMPYNDENGWKINPLETPSSLSENRQNTSLKYNENCSHSEDSDGDSAEGSSVDRFATDEKSSSTVQETTEKNNSKQNNSTETGACQSRQAQIAEGRNKKKNKRRKRRSQHVLQSPDEIINIEPGNVNPSCPRQEPIPPENSPLKSSQSRISLLLTSVANVLSRGLMSYNPIMEPINLQDTPNNQDLEIHQLKSPQSDGNDQLDGGSISSYTPKNLTEPWEPVHHPSPPTLSLPDTTVELTNLPSVCDSQSVGLKSEKRKSMMMLKWIKLFKKDHSCEQESPRRGQH